MEIDPVTARGYELWVRLNLQWDRTPHDKIQWEEPMSFKKSHFDHTVNMTVHLLRDQGYEVIRHSGKISDSEPAWKHLSTEMTEQGWYLINKGIPQVVHLSYEGTFEEAVFFATSYLVWERFAT